MLAWSLVLLLLCLCGKATAAQQERPSRSSVSWGGARDTIEFDNSMLASLFAYGMRFSTIALPQVPKEQRAKWHPSNATNLNVETDFFDEHCENVADGYVLRQVAACNQDVDCDYDYLSIVAYGTVPGMSFADDGRLLVSCAAVESPKDCATSPDSCPFTLIKAIGPDFTPLFIKSMQHSEPRTQLVADASESLYELLLASGYSPHKAIRKGAPSRVPHNKQKTISLKQYKQGKAVIKTFHRQTSNSTHWSSTTTTSKQSNKQSTNTPQTKPQNLGAKQPAADSKQRLFMQNSSKAKPVASGGRQNDDADKSAGKIKSVPENKPSIVQPSVPEQSDAKQVVPPAKVVQAPSTTGSQDTGNPFMLGGDRLEGSVITLSPEVAKTPAKAPPTNGDTKVDKQSSKPAKGGPTHATNDTEPATDDTAPAKDTSKPAGKDTPQDAPSPAAPSDNTGANDSAKPDEAAKPPSDSLKDNTTAQPAGNDTSQSLPASGNVSSSNATKSPDTSSTAASNDSQTPDEIIVDDHGQANQTMDNLLSLMVFVESYLSEVPIGKTILRGLNITGVEAVDALIAHGNTTQYAFAANSGKSKIAKERDQIRAEVA